CGERCQCDADTTRAYRRYDTGSREGVFMAGVEFPFHESCDNATCPDGQVNVETDPGHFECAPPPPDCPARWSFERKDGTWVCKTSCDVVVSDGSLFKGKRSCASEPPACGSGLTATFDAGSEEWMCL